MGGSLGLVDILLMTGITWLWMDGCYCSYSSGNNPAYVPLAAFFMAYLDKGGKCLLILVFLHS